MTTAQAAKALNVSRRRVLALIAGRRLAAVKHGRDYLISPVEVRKFKRRGPGRPRSKA